MKGCDFIRQTYGVAAFFSVCNRRLTIYTDFLVVMQPPILVESDEQIKKGGNCNEHSGQNSDVKKK